MQDYPHGRYQKRTWNFFQLYPQSSTIFEIRYPPGMVFNAGQRILFTKYGQTHIYEVLGLEDTFRTSITVVFVVQELSSKGIP